jgi:bifunctional DNA-binding transcriptional regulator/antitoxin component of YhaV-PrlF toxin-antitoxin module
MALVAVKKKYQVVIPRELRAAIGVEVGGLLEAKAVKGKITFTPKAAVDRGVGESLADFAAGRSYDPFKAHKELIASLHRETAKLHSKTSSKRKPRRRRLDIRDGSSINMRRRPRRGAKH